MVTVLNHEYDRIVTTGPIHEVVRAGLQQFFTQA
jgi:hypothetical protein